VQEIEINPRRRRPVYFEYYCDAHIQLQGAFIVVPNHFFLPTLPLDEKYMPYISAGVETVSSSVVPNKDDNE
jgi:hypothetical protein